MEWGWVCLLLSKQKPQNVFRATPAWCEMSSGYIGGRVFKPTTGLSPFTTRKKTSATSEEQPRKMGHFFFPEEIDNNLLKQNS